MKIKDFAKKVGENALALKTIYDKKKSAKDFGNKTEAVKLARSYEGAPNWNPDGSVSDAQKARIMGRAAKDDYLRSFKK